MTVLKWLGGLISMATLLAAALAAEDTPTWSYPGATWEKITNPSDLGFSDQELAHLTSFLETQNTQGLHVSVGGKEVFSYGDPSANGYIASVRKSVLAMLYGPYVADGTIDLDKTIGELGLTDVGGLLDIEKRATIRHIISARSGVYHAASNGGDSAADAPRRGTKQPGSFYLYNNWDFNAAGAIFEKLTGKDIFQALNDQFAMPLQFEDFDLATHQKSGNPERSKFLAYHMNLSARDLGRLGHFMLSKGRWQGDQIIPADWVDEMVLPHTPHSEMFPASFKDQGMQYGYMWWVLDDASLPLAYKGAYAGRGHFGQYLAVIPALDMVVGHKTKPVRYSSAEEYAAVRVTWEQFKMILDHLVAARLSP